MLLFKHKQSSWTNKKGGQLYSDTSPFKVSQYALAWLFYSCSKSNLVHFFNLPHRMSCVSVPAYSAKSIRPPPAPSCQPSEFQVRATLPPTLLPSPLRPRRPTNRSRTRSWTCFELDLEVRLLAYYFKFNRVKNFFVQKLWPQDDVKNDVQKFFLSIWHSVFSLVVLGGDWWWTEQEFESWHQILVE